MADFLAYPRVYRSDIYQTVLEDLTPSKLSRAVMTYNDDYATKRTAEFEVLWPDEVRDLDFILIDIDLVDAWGTVETIAGGHYVVTGRDTTMTDTTRIGTLQGHDLTWFLAQETLRAVQETPAGEDPGAAVRDILLGLGIPEALIDVPDAGVPLVSKIRALPGDTWLAYTTRLLEAGNMYQLWVNRARRITSRRLVDIATAPADARYHTADGAKVKPGVRNTPDLAQLKNRIVVVKTQPDADPLYAVAEVDDRSSPLHPDNLAERLNRTRPVILGEKVEDAQVATQAEAQLLADTTLSYRGSFLDRLSFITKPDDTLDGHMILDMDVVFPADGISYHEGNWLQRVCQLTVDGAMCEMSRECTRTVAWR